ncbi:hypothetical protein ACISU4_35000 [Streptomyces wuyuanensis]|uniref:hypothetical protein n=1 Tax=Streptomyces wuyuanensis TaxID=1196353 RepID=UPI00382E7EB1
MTVATAQTAVRSLLAHPTGSVLGAEPGGTENAETYIRSGGYGEAVSPDRLLEAIDRAGLRGRGGAP